MTTHPVHHSLSTPNIGALNTTAWHYEGSWRVSPLFVDWQGKGVSRFAADVFEPTVPAFNKARYLTLDGHASYIAADNRQAILTTLRNQQDIPSMRRHLDTCKQSIERLKRFPNQLPARVNRLNRDDLASLWSKCGDEFQRVMPFLFSFNYFEEILEGMLDKALETSNAIPHAAQRTKALTCLHRSRKKSAVQEEAHQLYKLGAELQSRGATLHQALDSGDMWARLVDHIEAFSWLQTYSFQGRPAELAQTLERLESLWTIDLHKKLECIKQSERDDAKEWHQLGQTLAQSGQQAIIERASLIQDFIWHKAYRFEQINAVYYALLPLFEHLSERVRLHHPSDLVWCSDTEIHSALQNPQISLEGVIHERRHGFTHYFDGNHTHFIGLADTHSLKATMDPHINSDSSSQLQGQVAYPGEVKGSARIVLSAADTPKIRKGDIVIARMTEPDIALALEHAAGIVTDAGGVLCHAAIVSRELRIPCLTATRHATHKFSDGDVLRLVAHPDGTGFVESTPRPVSPSTLSREPSTYHLIQDLRNLDSQAQKSVGGKALSLAKLIQSDVPVPPGIVVRTEAFEAFLSDATVKDRISRKLNSLNTTSSLIDLKQLAQSVAQIIENHPFPPQLEETLVEALDTLGPNPLAVRSSAIDEDGMTYSFAGQMESFLHIAPRDVKAHLKACWASYYTPRALLYRQKHSLPIGLPRMGVVIQTMIPATQSGIAFGRNPLTRDTESWVIEAGHGIGEWIVGGHITPDRYLVNKRYGYIESRTVQHQPAGLGIKEGKLQGITYDAAIATQAKLNDPNIQRLSTILARIEEAFAQPMDVEWAILDNDLFITQARPITA